VIQSPLLCPLEDKARIENKNADDHLDLIACLVHDYKIEELRESHVLELQKLAIQDIYPCGGTYRDARVAVHIANSPHRIPEPALVPALVQQSIDWINRERHRPPLERAAYALWRFNWIHPFRGGNGRTSRAVAYLIVCMSERTMLPGSPAMPDLICGRRDEYIRALQKVDAAAMQDPDAPDFSAMLAFLTEMITTQLASALVRLSGSYKTS
jgi:Fic family protein